VGLKFYATCLFENMAERVGFPAALILKDRVPAQTKNSCLDPKSKAKNGSRSVAGLAVLRATVEPMRENYAPSERRACGPMLPGDDDVSLSHATFG